MSNNNNNSNNNITSEAAAAVASSTARQGVTTSTSSATSTSLASSTNLAPFVASVLRDKVVTDLHAENTRLNDENTRLQAENTRLHAENTRLDASNTRIYNDLRDALAQDAAMIAGPRERDDGGPNDEPSWTAIFLFLIALLYAPLLLHKVTASAIFGKGVIFLCTHGLAHDDYCN